MEQYILSSCRKERRKERRKEGRNRVLRRFQQLRPYRNEIETRYREGIPFSPWIIVRGLLVAEQQTARRAFI